MRRFIFFAVFFFICTISPNVAPAYAEGVYTPIPSPYEPARIRFNNENWFSVPHPKIANFFVYSDGSASGITENGITFTQRNVPNEYGVRIQRFEMQDHFHYIIEGTDVYTITELAIKLANISSV